MSKQGRMAVHMPSKRIHHGGLLPVVHVYLI